MIKIEKQDGIASITMDDGKANVLSLESCQAISNAMTQCRQDKAIILRGNGKIFSAGVDLVRLSKNEDGYLPKFYKALVNCLESLIQFPGPLIAEVAGHAIAGGCIIAGACDFRIAATDSGRIGVPELTVGVPFPVIALEILRERVSPQRFTEVVYLGKTYSMTEGREIGLIDEIVDPTKLQEHCQNLANKLVAIPTETFRLTKANIRYELCHRILQQAALEKQIELCWQQPQTMNAIEAFVAKTLNK